jgi:hypothetical protein
MSHFLFFWLILILSNVLKNASCLVDCLTLLKESDKLEWVSGHHLVQVLKLELMQLGLRKKRFVYSSLVLWVLSLFDGGSHHQDS